MHKKLVSIVGISILGGMLSFAVVSSSVVASRRSPAPEPGITQVESERIVEEWRSVATAEQSAAFSDGVLTVEEYRAAVDRTIECIKADAGSSLTVSPATLSVDAFRLTYDMRVDGSGSVEESDKRLAEISVVEQKCQSINQWAVENAYQAQYLAQPLSKGTENGMRACLTAAKVQVEKDRSVRDLILEAVVDREPSAEVLACVANYPSLTSFPASPADLGFASTDLSVGNP